jgi:dihydrofolate reductase
MVVEIASSRSGNRVTYIIVQIADKIQNSIKNRLLDFRQAHTMRISLISAMDQNRLIGDDNRLPWYLPADFAHFKAVTMGKPVLMGRKTYESIGRPLPGRLNIVLTRNTDLEIASVVTVTSIEQAMQAASGADELMVIGGSTIYEMLLPVADRLYLTYVEAEFHGDAWFPAINQQDWQVVEQREHPVDEKNAYRCRFVTLERSKGSS